MTGTWTRPTSDVLRWTTGNIIFESIARYDSNNLYIGRYPRLSVNGIEQTFEDAVAFAESLGHRSKWVNRSYGDEDIQ
jgi:hypothetical protein